MVDRGWSESLGRGGGVGHWVNGGEGVKWGTGGEWVE